MKWTPRIIKDYVLTPTQYVFAQWTFWVASAIFLIGESKMLDNIDNLYLAVACAFATVIAWIGIVQYSRKVLDDTEDASHDSEKPKFALIPYLVIPIIWGAVAVGLGLYAGNFLIGRYGLASEDGLVLCAGLSLLIYMVLDWKVVSMCGDAKYFLDLEKEAVKSAETAAESKTIKIGEKEYTLDEIETLRTVLKK